MSRTPQGVRGLKPGGRDGVCQTARRTPQGVRGLKQVVRGSGFNRGRSHSARSAWIETGEQEFGAIISSVALRKECVD